MQTLRARQLKSKRQSPTLQLQPPPPPPGAGRAGSGARLCSHPARSRTSAPRLPSSSISQRRSLGWAIPPVNEEARREITSKNTTSCGGKVLVLWAAQRQRLVSTQNSTPPRQGERGSAGRGADGSGERPEPRLCPSPGCLLPRARGGEAESLAAAWGKVPIWAADGGSRTPQSRR